MLSSFRRLWQILTVAQRRRIVLLTGAIVVSAFLEVASVSAIAPFLAVASDPARIEDVAVLACIFHLLPFDDTDGFLIAVGTGVFFLMVTSNTWSVLTWRAQLRMIWSLNHELSLRLLERYLYRPYVFFLSRNTAEVSKNFLSEVNQLTISMIQPVMYAVSRLFVALGIVIMLFVTSPLLALMVTLVVGGSYAVIFVFMRRRLAAIGKDRVQANQERHIIAAEALGGIKDVRVLNVESTFLARFADPSRRLSMHEVTSQTISALPKYAIETVAFGTVVLIVVYFVAVERDFSGIVPMLGLYAFSGYRLLPALQQIFHAVTAAKYSSSTVEVVLSDLLEVPAIKPRPTGVSSTAMGLSKQLELQQVRFSYPGSQRRVVDDVSLVIPANSVVGFVGATGSGKTTLIDIILGLLRPHSGEIIVDGTPINEENLSAWQMSIGYVPQHIFLSDSTVAENIAFGVPKDEIDMEAVRAAARIAQIDEFIMNELPSGYDTVVGERGIRLSGGQRQRLGIARALYRDPDVIVFDEATSALDNVTERQVMQAIRDLRGKKTILMVAHRLTTLEDCDTIYLLSGGRIVSQGTYEELIAGRGAFVEIVGTKQ